MDLTSIAAIAYGILSVVGGIVGYAQASSKPSLIAGVVSGILLVLGGIAHERDANWGLPLAMIVAGILVVVFAVRLWKTRKFMPAGFMLAAGVAALIVMTRG